MDNIQLKTAFVAVFDKSNLNELATLFRHYKISALGTAGSAKYLNERGVVSRSVVSGFDFDGRVKSLDRKNFGAILADKSKPKHLVELNKLRIKPIEAVIVDLYKPDRKHFPETMDIGGQALIRGAIKNYQNVVVAFDPKSMEELAWEIKRNKGVVSLAFRKKQAAKALKFIAERCRLEASLF